MKKEPPLMARPSEIIDRHHSCIASLMLCVLLLAIGFALVVRFAT